MPATLLGKYRPVKLPLLNNAPPDSKAQVKFQYRKDGIQRPLHDRQSDHFPVSHLYPCMQHRNPILGYSKSSMGSFRLVAVFRHLHQVTTLTAGWVDMPNHYASCGQNLPDKEFRYLRTVIVTAAVHWGFDSMPHISLNLQHRAGVTVYVIFDLSTNLRFCKQLLGPILCGSIAGAPFSEASICRVP